MKMKSSIFKRVFVGMGLVFLSATSSVATKSEEDTFKRVQQAKYKAFTGIWEIRLNEEIRPLEAGFKNFLPGLDYVLVDEKMRDAGRNTLIFRGQGDTKVVIKLRTYGIFTKISIRIGITGNQSKSAQLFSYVYRRM
tara:strand:- start:1002 stop:1412 length:411 start_codon:yes stop_codon:yes gene_type:complete